MTIANATCDYFDCRHAAQYVVPGRGDDHYICADHLQAELDYGNGSCRYCGRRLESAADHRGCVGY